MLLKEALLIGAAVGGVASFSTSASATETITYSYDALGRLTKLVTSGTVNSGETVTVVHDKADNRSTYVVTGA